MVGSNPITIEKADFEIMVAWHGTFLMNTDIYDILVNLMSLKILSAPQSCSNSVMLATSGNISNSTKMWTKIECINH